jgi:outer membrane protein assembly factor BamB
MKRSYICEPVRWLRSRLLMGVLLGLSSAFLPLLLGACDISVAPMPSPGSVLWKAQIIGTTYATPVAVADGAVYVGTRDHAVAALDGRTGTQRWRTHLEAVRPDANTIPPFVWTVADGAVYAVMIDIDGNFIVNTVYALDAATGTERWQTQIRDSLSALTVTNGVLYAGSWSFTLYALDARTGARRWQVQVGTDRIAAPSVAGGMVYESSPFDPGFVYALDATTGVRRWRFQGGNLCCDAPTVANGVVYVGTDDSLVYALDAATGAQRWRAHTGTSKPTMPTVADGVVYLGSYDHSVYALDAATGALRWQFQTEDRVVSAPTVANRVVYVSSTESDHHIYALDAATGKLRWRFQINGAYFAPVVANGVAYVGSNDGFLYALSA